MKAVLLAAGKGERLQPLTNKISKQMITIAGKPFLEYVINDIVRLGFDDICIVIGHLGNQIQDYFKDGRKFNAKIRYVTQKEFKGTADATNYAREFVGSDKFLLYLTDTLIPGLENYLKNMLNQDPEIEILSAKIDDSEISSAGNIELDGDYVKEISEKPKHSKSNLAWAGIALFKSNLIFKIIENLKPSFRGEYEITDAMNQVLQNNKKIKNHICERYIDSGTPKGLIEATKFILSNNNLTQNFSKSQVSTIEPIYVGKNCVIGEGSNIGPFVSIGNNVTIGRSVTIEESLILDESNIESNQNIKKSIISSHCTI
jgi:glucose-1-phosphate thymidylyltransferase